MDNRDSKLRIFEAHGVILSGHESGDEVVGSCPFTGKDDKFYINTKTWLWDSKTAGFGGNVHTFLGRIAKLYQRQLTKARLRDLAEHRGLPVDAFTGWGIGWTGDRYSIPVRAAGGTVVDIRTFAPGEKSGVKSTAGCKVGLLGSERMPERPSEPVYLCEGEWDAIALEWLRRSLSKPGVVVGVPGAGTLKLEWLPWFSGRVIHTLYDNDGPGELGEYKAFKKLKPISQSVTAVHWPDGLASGFDVRDWILYDAIKRGKRRTCWRTLHALFQPRPRKAEPPKLNTASPAEAEVTGPPLEPFKSRWKRPPTLDDVFRVFRRWLFLDSTDGIVISLATYISQRIDGPPVWMFLVGPPGSAKTETLTSLAQAQGIYMTSTLTPHALISGANWKDSVDPSLIPRLDGKVMVIKDFTSILAMRDVEKDEIFGILRDAYDGRCGKVFGTGIERTYESRFTILAAVTPRIHDLSQQHTSLGERFLKFAVGDNLVHHSEEAIIERAIDNISQDTKMKEELQDVVQAFLNHSVGRRKEDVPTIPPVLKRRIIHLGRFGARMRGTVSRDTYRNEIMTGRPSAEVGSRLGIQLAKLAKSIAMVYGRPEVTEADYNLVRKAMVDTIPQRTEDVLRSMLKLCPTHEEYARTQEIAADCRYPLTTVSRILQDLNVLDVVERIGTAYRHEWTVSNYIRKSLGQAELYGHTAPQPMRVRRRRHT